jgi:hemolysin-activating ACP:hemolysin acyltransferase
MRLGAFMKLLRYCDGRPSLWVVWAVFERESQEKLMARRVLD